MTRGNDTLESPPREVAEGPSDAGRPPVASDPWTAGWTPPSRKTLARKHARAIRRERELARNGHRDAAVDSDAADRTTSIEPDQTRRPPVIPTTPEAPGRLFGSIAAVATAYWYWVVATIVIAVAIPLVSGWSASTVSTGSMEPTVSPGDVVAFAEYDGRSLQPGTIIQFDDPVRPGETVTHRVVGINDDGTYTTRGDANAAPDSTPVPPDAILGVATLVAPRAGLPQIWWMHRDYTTFGIWVAVTAAAVAIMSIHGRASENGIRPRRRPERRRSIVRPALALGLLLAAAGVGTAAWSQARFSAAADPPVSSFSSASSFQDFEHLGFVGSATCGTSSSTVGVDATIEAGSTVVVRFALRDLRGGAGYSGTDSAGNAYTVDAVANDGSRSEVAVLSAHVATALAPGDTIVITHPEGRASVVAVDAFSGIASTNRVAAVGAGSGNDQTPTIAVSVTEVPALVVGHIAVRDLVAVLEPATGWTPLVSQPTTCDRDLTHRSAWQQWSSPGTTTYAPTFVDKANRWSGVIVAYRGD